MSTKIGIQKLKNVFKKSDFKEEVEFETQLLVMAFLSAIEKEADLQKISRKDLAKIVETSPSYITQIFRGNKIPNLKILTALGLALNKKFDINAVDDIHQHRKSYDDIYHSEEEMFDSRKIGIGRTMKVAHRREPHHLTKECEFLS